MDGLNRRVALKPGYQLSLWRWETNARSGMHIEGPQGLIDERMQIDESDIAVGIFCKRFGPRRVMRSPALSMSCAVQGQRGVRTAART